MMKYIHCLLLLFAVSVNIVFAQAQRPATLSEKTAAERWVLPLADQEIAAKTTDVIGSRLIKTAWGYYNGNKFPYTDSSVYQYSPTRGYHEKLGWMFDTLTTVRKDANAPSGNVPLSRSVHFFDAAGKITDLEVQNWNSTNMMWEMIAKIKFTYINSTLSATTQSTVINGVLTPVTKMEFSTNTIVHTSTTLRQDWDAANSQWKYADREVTYYGTNGPDSIRYELRNGTQWDLNKLTTYTYTNGNATYIERSLKNGSSWTVEYKETNQYDNNNNKTQAIYEYYDHATSSWGDPTKEEYTYNNNKNLTQTIGYKWVTNQYVEDYKQVQTFNSYSQVLTFTTFQWDGNNTWIHKVGEDLQQRNYYEEYATQIKNISEHMPAVQMYPIPANDILYISWHTPQSALIQLYDMQGKLVLKQLVKENVSAAVNLGELTTGNYLLNVSGSIRFSNVITVSK